MENKRLTESQMEGLIGPTGKFPDGKICPEDEGELKFGVGLMFDQVAIKFHAPVSMLIMGKKDALALAVSITQFANQIPD